MKKIPFEKIKKIVAKTLGVKIEEIDSRNRYRMPALARQYAMHYALRGRTLVSVGKYFDRHHANVSHADDKIKFLKENDWECKEWAKKIEKELAL